MKKLLYCIALLASALSVLATDWDRGADARKAAYIFIDAQNDLCQGNYSDYYAKLRRANALDPTDLDIAAEYAELLLQTADLDSEETEQAYGAMWRRFAANPGDFATATPVAELAAKLGKLNDVAAVWKAMCAALPDRNDPSMNLADTYVLMYMRGDSAAYDSAMTIYSRLEQGLGFDIGLSSHKIRALSLRRDTAAVAAELARISTAAPTDPQALLYAGQVFESLGMPDSAIARYDRACSLDSTDGRALMLRAAVHLSQGDSAAYDSEVFRALESQNLDLENKMSILSGYIRALFSDSTQHGRIDHLFRVMNEVNPGEPQIHALNAIFLAQTKRPAEAAEQAGYALDLDRDNAELWSLNIQLQNECGNDSAVIDLARRGARHFPESFYFPLVGSGKFFTMGDYAGARAMLDSFDIAYLETPEDLSTYWTLRGDAGQHLGDSDSTVTYYERAVMLNPHNYGAMNNFAYYLAENDTLLDRAEHYAALAVKNEPESETYLDTYAWIFFRKKEFTLARRYIDAALRLMRIDPADPAAGQQPAPEGGGDDDNVRDIELSGEIFDHAGDIYFMCGERRLAVEFWQEARKLMPDNALLRKKTEHKTIFFE